MKAAMYSLVLAGWASTGCMTLPQLWEQPKPPPARTATLPSTAAQDPMVRPEQVDENNARQMAAALNQEMELEARQPPLGSAPASGAASAADSRSH